MMALADTLHKFGREGIRHLPGPVHPRLRAALPLPDLTADPAVALVVEHRVNRTRSRRSRRNRQFLTGHDP